MDKLLALKVKIKKIYLSLRRISLLFIVAPFLSKKEKSFSLHQIKKILIIRIDRIGDLMLSTPALRAVRKKIPQADITLVLNPSIQDLAKVIPWIDKTVVYRNLIQAARALKQEGFDLAIDLLMDYPLKSALLAFLSGARYRVGYNIQGRGGFFNIKVKPDSEEKHMIERTLDVVRAIGVDTVNRNPEIVVLDEEKKYIEHFLNQRKVSSKDLLVGIHPGGNYPSQCWQPERFAQLADEIIIEYGAEVIVIGGPGEEGLVRKVVNLMSEKAIEVIDIPLSRLAALIARCNLFVCNNSGPLHIATAVGTPTISTMGPTVSYLWWPQGKNHIVIRKDLPCSPCNRGVCKSHQCMDLITVEDMKEAVKIQMKRINEEDKTTIF